jgi:polyribonucleotide nucleotidyltransferase
MAQVYTQVKEKIGDRTLELSTGKLAGLAQGSVTAQYGETVVLTTACISPEPKEAAEFFPMQVEYEERFYAAGKIAGSRFIKRENRPPDSAVLAARMVDRPLRPLFPKNYRNDLQIIVTVLSVDLENDPDIIAINAASAALLSTTAPFAGPVGAVRVGIDELGNFIINPTHSQRDKSPLDLVVAGTKERINMIEAAAKEVKEEVFLQAIEFAIPYIQQTIALQEKLAEKIAAGKVYPQDTQKELYEEISKVAGKRIAKLLREADKKLREENLAKFETEILQSFEGNYKQVDIKSAFQTLIEKEVRRLILEENLRPDGRKLDEIREIQIEVGLLPRTHGSALFTRGQTQVLTIATLGAPGEEQIIETMEEEFKKRFMHHYNFPPYSTGEIRPMKGASRREIGHGALAEKALEPVLPPQETFPYTIRLVSETLSSNGSSSMASVCGSSLALMDAGVPISAPVAGIAMGLVTDEKAETTNYKILTDIQGIEDFGGDMDFKIAGTKEGITAIQLDTKISGLTLSMIEETFTQARKARLEILEKMQAVLPAPRKELSPYAPRITTIKIDPSKIGLVIGPGGKTINQIIEAAGGRELVAVDIESDGTVMVSSNKPESTKTAIALIENLTKEIKVGEVYTGPVTQIVRDRKTGKEIGAIVKITPYHDGMVHISELANYHVPNVHSIVKVGDRVRVQVVDVDKERGRISLSLKRLNDH